jgi:hypothetical protein
MSDQRKDDGGLAVILAAGCLVVLLCLVTARVGWVAMRRCAATERVAAVRAELQAKQQATATTAVTEELATAREQAIKAQQDAIEKAQQEIKVAATLPTIGQADGSSQQNGKVDGAAEQPIPEEVLALVPLLMRWAVDESPLPGLPNVKCDASHVRDARKDKSVKTFYVFWNGTGIKYNEDGVYSFNLPYKYDFATGKVLRTAARDNNDVKERIGDPSIGPGEYVTVFYKEEVYGNLLVRFAVGWTEYEFYFHLTNKGYRAVKQNPSRPLGFGK